MLGWVERRDCPLVIVESQMGGLRPIGAEMGKESINGKIGKDSVNNSQA